MLFYNKRNICSQTLDIQDDQGVRQQFNAQSSFLDADNVYGYSEQRAKQVEFTQFLIYVLNFSRMKSLFLAPHFF